MSMPRSTRRRRGTFGGGPTPLRKGSASDLGDVLGGGALLALHDVELDPLAFSERLEAAALNGGVVNEAILLPVLRRDEAEALGVVEPLHRAGSTHCGTPGVWCVG